MNITNNNQISFGHFRISYAAEEKLTKLSPKELCRIRRLAKHVRHTEEYDFCLDKNLKPRIKDNSILYSSYIAPFKVSKVEENPFQLRISTTKLNEHPLGQGKKTPVDLYIEFKKKEEANSVYKRLNTSNDEIERGVILTRMLEVERLSQMDQYLADSLPRGKRSIIDEMMYRYGDDSI